MSAAKESSETPGTNGLESNAQERLLDVHDLSLQLEEAQDILRAIRRGEVDALVVKTEEEEERVYTLKGANLAYRVMFDTLNEGALTLGMDGTILYANRRFAEMVEQPREAVIGAPFEQFLQPQMREAYTALLKDVSRAPGRSELILTHPDSGEVPVMLSLRCVSQQGMGEVCTAVVTDLTELRKAQIALEQANADLEKRVAARTAELNELNAALQEEIAERRRLEGELRQRAEELAEADRRKDQFLATVAHELRNPLGPIRNAVQLLQHLGPKEPQLVRARKIIERQVNQQARLLDDLLDVSRITQDKVTLQQQRVDLVQIVKEALEDGGSAVEAAGLSLDLHLPEQPVWVIGDPTRLSQVVGNVLNNAVKFTPRAGQVMVRLESVPGTPQEVTGSAEPTADAHDVRSAVLTVCDTGVGIAPEMLPRVFETFAQAEQSLDRSRGGLGLGLALVKGLVELHGGQVRACSDGIGRGAEFQLVLPLAAAGEQPPVAPAATAQGRGALRILIVEDNRDAAETLRELLELCGCTVKVAYSGAEGVQAAQQFEPEVVLCDLGLPEVDGYKVACELRQHPSTANARLIAISGYGQEADQQRSREAGFSLHLTKPIDFSRLQRVLEISPTRPPD